METNNIKIDCILSRTRINSIIDEVMQQYTGKTFEGDGFQFTLKSNNTHGISVSAQNKIIGVSLPVHFQFLKPAGLFSIEGEGNIRMNLDFHIDISEDFKIAVNSKWNGYTWIEPPVIHIGELNIPIETLASCLIRYMEESILDKLDHTINRTINIHQYIRENIEKYATNFLIHKKPDLYFNGILQEVKMSDFKSAGDDIQCAVWIDMLQKISDKPVHFQPPFMPEFSWSSTQNAPRIQHIEVEITYEGLAKMIKNEIQTREIGGKKFNVDHVGIRYTNMLEIKLSLVEPIKGIVTILCRPFLHENDHTICLNDLEVDVNAENLLYKLSSPLIEKILTGKLESLFPIDPLTYLEPMISALPVLHVLDNKIKITPSVHDIKLLKIDFLTHALEAKLLAGEMALGVKV